MTCAILLTTGRSSPDWSVPGS